VLVVDDTGKKRAKVTKRIPDVHHFKDKDSTGTIRDQEVVFLVWVTPVVTLRVAFMFYQPDPAYVAWLREWLEDDAFADKLDQLTQAIRPLFPLQPSAKHRPTRELGRLEPTPALKYWAQYAQASASC
jgi:hypothetical protein